ncbi:right-handed parallel beta-helix repeat-containing protein [Subtercola sp. YIM 133946]|uniref:right-handed parallel beta-helix repeat-containing protein n=1 Tax=Subtercola sp. YIM 133946 TaxID=3118909 RepID=UPI002F95D0F9
MPRHASRPVFRRLSKPASILAAVAVLAGAAVALPVAASATAVVVATDTFSRTTSSGWGAASPGGTYSTSGAATFSVGSGTAKITGLAPTKIASATLGSVSGQNVNMVGTILVPASPITIYPALELRRQSNGNLYRATVQVGSSGNVALQISRTAGGVDTALSRVPLPFTAIKATSISVEFQAVGTGSSVEVAARAWQAGSTKPGWQSVISDTSSSRILAAGSVGVFEYAGASNTAKVTTAFDNFTVTTGASSTDGSAASPTTPTPTPTPTPAPTGSTSSGKGSADVGTTAYAVPSNAIIVAVSGGSDSNAGTLAKPMKTVAAAIAKASSGQTIVLRAGAYHESVTVPAEKKLTIQSYPKEAVWFDGSSQVTSWTKSGSTWKTSWSFFPARSLLGVTDNPRFVDAAYPMAGRPDQVFVNDVLLTQVGSAAAVTSGTFFPDPSSKTITIGTDPTSKTVRVSDLGTAIVVNGPGTVLQGFGVHRYATTYDQQGAVGLYNDNLTARNLVIEDNAMIGIRAWNDNMLIDHVTFQRNGMLGIVATTSYHSTIKNSVFTVNNNQRFKTEPEAGGAKIARSRDFTFTNNDTSNNFGTGLWFDESSYDVTVTNNTSLNNTQAGIELELSANGIVAGNDVSNNPYGLYIIDTSDLKVFNNKFDKEGQMGIRIVQDERRQADPSWHAQDPRQPIPDPTVTWIVKNIQISNNVFGTWQGFQVFAWDSKTGRTADQMNITISGNLFNHRTTLSQATLVAWGTGTNTFTRFDTVAALKAKNSGWVNQETPSALSVSSMLSAITSAASTAVPLPADVAAATGQSTGLKKVGLF